MFMLTILRRTGLSICAAHLPQQRTLPLRRCIFNPSLKPPPTGPVVHREFPDESRAHLSPDQFKEVHRSSQSRGAYYGITDGRPKSLENVANETPAERWLNKSFKLITQPATTYAGRSALVVEGNVAQAWNKLQAVLRQNNVRQELRMTERHEKKGVKRRRLRSERWRRKFADEVGKKVRLVNEIRLRDRMWGGSRH